MDKIDKSLILVAGATGLQGGSVIEALLNKGVAIRAIVRNKNSESSQNLAAKGVEIVEATFEDVESLTRAATGATGVFSVQMGSHPGNKGEETQHAKNLVAAAKTAGVQQIVHTSVARAGEHENFVDWGKGRWEPSYWEEKAAAIDAVKNAGFPYWTILKPPYLMENLLPPRNVGMYPTITQGKLITPVAPETKIDWATARDIGRFAAEAFTQPDKFNKKEIAIVGDKLTMSEVADLLSTVTGKRFEATSISVEEAKATGLFNWGVEPYVWQNVEGYKIDPQEATGYGILPKSLKAFLEGNKSVLQEVYSGVQ
jgi:uncharacterized protein YbjT (DUF2867 family)